MKSTFFLILFSIMFFSCQKEKPINGTRDLKNLSLPQLKEFINGKWRLRRADLFTIAGLNKIIFPDSVRSFLIFYPIDSVRREVETTNIIIREKLVYEYLSLPGTNGISTYVLMFDKDYFGYRNNWVADSLVNDTLIFANYFKSEGVDRFYYTREQ